VFKFVYYTGASIWAVYLFKDSEVLPPWLGGKGSLANHYTNWPYSPQIPGLVIYSLVQMGYYLEDVVEHNFFRPKTNDYWEMNLHHLLTIGLFSGMILLNVVRSGALVSLLHNVSDIPTTSSRILSQTVFKRSTQISAATMIIVWFLVRNIAIPIFCIGCWYNLILPP